MVTLEKSSVLDLQYTYNCIWQKSALTWISSFLLQLKACYSTDLLPQTCTIMKT